MYLLAPVCLSSDHIQKVICEEQVKEVDWRLIFHWGELWTNTLIEWKGCGLSVSVWVYFSPASCTRTDCCKGFLFMGVNNCLE